MRGWAMEGRGWRQDTKRRERAATRTSVQREVHLTPELSFVIPTGSNSANSHSSLSKYLEFFLPSNVDSFDIPNPSAGRLASAHHVSTRFGGA